MLPITKFGVGSMHSDTSAAPGAGVMMPPGQVEQASTEGGVGGGAMVSPDDGRGTGTLKPTPLVYFPMGHSEHDAAPEAMEIVPGLQYVHCIEFQPP